MFNPPYLPGEETGTYRPFDYSWNGGREVTERFLEGVEGCLHPTGRVLMIQSSLSRYEKTLSTLRAKGFRVKILAEKPLFFERLYLLEAKMT